MYQFVREAKKRDFASFQHHNQVFRQAIVEAADNQALLPQRTSRYEKPSRLFRSARLLAGILVFGAGSGRDPSASV
jgi:DNA-binding GntR family transcriptional regulator